MSSYSIHAPSGPGRRRFQRKTARSIGWTNSFLTMTSNLEHRLAQLAHWGLYMLMILMPLTGYIGTSAPTDFGLFIVPSFRDTFVFERIASLSGATWEAFEAPVDWIHHFLGKWIAWVIVCLHIAAALLHHYVRRDDVLLRMLPRPSAPKDSPA